LHFATEVVARENLHPGSVRDVSIVNLSLPIFFENIHPTARSGRLHGSRHTYASFRAGGGPGLPVIGRLLGHAQSATIARYAHSTTILCDARQNQSPDVWRLRWIESLQQCCDSS